MAPSTGVVDQSKQPPRLARTDRILPGLWRLRLPLPWIAVPHVNAFALQRGDGVVLVDCGYAGSDGAAQLELALAQAGFDLTDVSLLVCTHAHADHYGLSATVAERAGCELWMHAAHAHVTANARDPAAAAQRKLELARQSSVPDELLSDYGAWLSDRSDGIAAAIEPDRTLGGGDMVTTDCGSWEVHETPGHAPSHIVLHQPERGLILSGDHLLGRVSLYFDYGYTPDPVAEFLGSLNVVASLRAGLCLSGHGRPFRDITAHIEANRAAVDDGLARIEAALSDRPRTGFDLVQLFEPAEQLTPMVLNWRLSVVCSLLDHLAASGRARFVLDDGYGLWLAAGS